MDRIDRNILAILQMDTNISVAELAKRVNLSTTPCWRRIQSLEEAGVISGRVALVDQRKVDLALTAFVSIKLASHDPRVSARLVEIASSLPEVVEIHRMGGSMDYLLKIIAPDIEAFTAVRDRIALIDGLEKVIETFSMETVKQTTALPLQHMVVKR